MRFSTTPQPGSTSCSRGPERCAQHSRGTRDGNRGSSVKNSSVFTALAARSTAVSLASSAITLSRARVRPPANRMSSALARVRHHRDVLEACQTSAFPTGPQVTGPTGPFPPQALSGARFACWQQPGWAGEGSRPQGHWHLHREPHCSRGPGLCPHHHCLPKTTFFNSLGFLCSLTDCSLPVRPFLNSHPHISM